MKQFCALDLEMNGTFPLAVALAKGYQDGDNLIVTDSLLFTISQKGKKINHYVKNHVVVQEELWQGTHTCKDAVIALLESTKDCDTIYSWGKETKLLASLIFHAGMEHDIRCKRMIDKLVDSQKMFEKPTKLESMYMLLGRKRLNSWHNPLTDALATLEIALLDGAK